MTWSLAVEKRNWLTGGRLGTSWDFEDSFRAIIPGYLMRRKAWSLLSVFCCPLQNVPQHALSPVGTKNCFRPHGRAQDAIMREVGPTVGLLSCLPTLNRWKIRAGSHACIKDACLEPGASCEITSKYVGFFLGQQGSRLLDSSSIASMASRLPLLV